MDTTLEVTVDMAPGMALPLTAERVEEALRWVLREEGAREADVSVAFVPDERIAALNEEYLGHQGPTDVISFPLPGPGRAVVGDIYVGAEQARRQAGELGVPLEEELMRLAIHGTLHVLGHEHPEDDDAAREGSAMYRRQEELLARVLAGPPRAEQG